MNIALTTIQRNMIRKIHTHKDLHDKMIILKSFDNGITGTIFHLRIINGDAIFQPIYNLQYNLIGDQEIVKSDIVNVEPNIGSLDSLISYVENFDNATLYEVLE